MGADHCFKSKKQDNENKNKEQFWKVEQYFSFYNFYLNIYKPQNYTKLESLTVQFDDTLFSTPVNIFEQYTNHNTNNRKNINSILNATSIIFPPNLKELCLDFTCCSYLENRTVSNIIQGLPQNLSSLELNLFNCLEISDRSFKELSNYGPKTLKSLKINLGDCREITSKSIKYITLYIYQLKNLNQIDLSFQWCQKIVNTTFINLITSFHFTKLQKIRLNFFNCGSINRSSIEALQNYLNLTHIEKINLNFSECNMIPIKTIKEFLKSLRTDYQESKIDFSQVENVSINYIIQKRQELYYERQRKYSLSSLKNSLNESVE